MHWSIFDFLIEFTGHDVPRASRLEWVPAHFKTLFSVHVWAPLLINSFPPTARGMLNITVDGKAFYPRELSLLLLRCFNTELWRQSMTNRC